MSAAAEIQGVVTRLNQCWLEGRFDDLESFFHPDVVFVSPDFEKRERGRQAAVDGYRSFMSQAVMHSFHMASAEVDVIGDTAVASCPFTMEYEIGGKRWSSQGRDLFVLTRDDRGWSIVWRTMLAVHDDEVEGLDV